MGSRGGLDRGGGLADAEIQWCGYFRTLSYVRLSFPLYRWENGGSERLGDFP